VFKTRPRSSSVLARPAWLRIAVLLPLLALLWLAVGWATMEVVPL
jgi:hypothetical protein